MSSFCLIDNLPSPPTGKTGWPWTERTAPMPVVMPDGKPWPRISIVTPNYNYAQFLEETIRSVLLQGYPNLEYIIVDSGSTDNSVEIIKKYGKWITIWETKSNRGQSHAINKGLEKSTGDILAYINSDDCYLPGAFRKAAEYFVKYPEMDFLYGRCWFVDENSLKIKEHSGSILNLEELLDVWSVWWKGRYFVQPEVFWTRRITDKIGIFFREDLNQIMDYEYWLRIFKTKCIVGHVETDIAWLRKHPLQKGNRKDKVEREFLMVLREGLWDKKTPIAFKKRLELQGKWLYQAIFLKQAGKSVAAGENRYIRWARLSAIALRHPKILFAPQFIKRIKQWCLRIYEKNRFNSN